MPPHWQGTPKWLPNPSGRHTGQEPSPGSGLHTAGCRQVGPGRDAAQPTRTAHTHNQEGSCKNSLQVGGCGNTGPAPDVAEEHFRPGPRSSPLPLLWHLYGPPGS